MSEKNVQPLQWKQKNSEQSIYASRNANIQSTSPIANQPAAAGAVTSANHPSHSGTTATNGRYPLIGSQQVVTSPASSTSSSSTSIGLQQHFHNMQHLQQQQQHHQQQQPQQQQPQQHHHHHSHHPQQQNPHFELSKIMAINSGTLTRLELPPSLGNHPVSSAITENVLSLIGMTSGNGNSSNRNSDGIKIPDEEKLRKVQAVVESGIGDHAKQQILQILDRISTLKPVERLLLYLRMPGETPESDPLRQPQNPLGTRSEINHTINWVRSHLEHDPKVSIPKQDVYNDYLAYCERLDIKPLSTADFGKVMKQVFPEIRPRRLGTRGHSRYCYAAMRKTTKLIPPQLPMIGGRTVDAISGGNEIESDPDAESWSTVRTWAEGLLNTKFESIKDLADHIGKNEYLGGAGSSRVLLQKKLLQRDAKEKRVYADSGPLKKRRKKKRKGSTSSESSTTQQASLNDSTISEDILLGAHTIKQEILDSPNSLHPGAPQMHLHHPATPYDGPIHGHQLLPMNLATENERNKALIPTNSPVAKNLTKTIADLPPSVSLLPIDPQSAQLASVKEEIINDEYNPQNVICKKVRRAHLAKGILGTGQTPSATITTAEAQQSVAPQVELSPAAVSTYSMGPPAQITTTAMESAKLASQVRARKLRLLQAHSELYQNYDPQQQPNHQQQPALVDNVEITEDKDVVLPENLGLPRERVISICNMDKHELDDYLNANDEDNSQDQEAELLQYFQTGDAENNNNNNKAMQQQQQQQHQLQQQQRNIDAHNPTLGEINTNSAFEVTNNNTLKKKWIIDTASGCFTRDRDDITQLRNYLHLNFNKDSNEATAALPAATPTINQRNVQGQKFSSNGNHYIMPGIYNEGSASASLAIMSQKHLNENASPSIAIAAAAAAAASTLTTTTSTSSVSNVAAAPVANHTNIPIGDYTPVPNNMRATQKRKINLNAMVPAPSTTQRRKNCTFFPISPNINLTNATTNSSSSSTVSSVLTTTNTNTNLFASPRLTTASIRTKPMLHKQQSLPAADKNAITSANDPMIGANRNNRIYNAITSASAPPSPSILQDNMMFGKNFNSGNPMSGYNPLLSSQDYQQSFTNSNKMLTNDQNSLECVLDEPPPHLMAESRSRSVPIQYRNSPAFNQTANYAGFSSTCNSAAQTPVPSQLADFSDPSSILDIFSDSSQTHGSSIKMEESSGSLLCGSVADILPPEYSRIQPNSFGGIVSRSVPSTPLPLHNIIDPFIGVGSNKKHQLKQDSFSSAQSKYSTKMYDISKSMPTTPITLSTATPSFRYSPEFNRDFLINGNTVESTPAYSRAPSVAGAAAPSLSDSLLDDGREGGSNSLTDGIDDLGSFGEVSESIIEADILNMNNL